MPKLSILLPTYNGAPYLAEQLDSILAQTDGDFELLALDDGSSDATVDLLDRYAARDPRVIRLPATGNAGQTARLIELLGHAAADFVAIADQDDRWAPNRNALLFAAIGARAMAYGRSQLIDKDGNPLGKTLLDMSYGAHQSNERLFALAQPMLSAHAMIVRRDAVNAEAFAHALPFDWLLGLEAMFGDGAIHVGESIVYHRLHDTNQCNTQMAIRDKARIGPGLRHAMLFRLPARMRLVAVFDYLGRSRLIAAEWRAKFLALSQHCHTIWFSEWRALRSSDAGLRDRIVDTLAPLAESPQDLARFTRFIDVLTQRAFSPPVLGELRRRLRHAGSR